MKARRIIQLDEAVNERLAQEARRMSVQEKSNVSVSEVIRRAIYDFLRLYLGKEVKNE